MDITKEAVTTRLSSLQNQLVNMKAMLEAVNGAIQDCQYWLDQLNQEEGAETPSTDVEVRTPQKE